MFKLLLLLSAVVLAKADLGGSVISLHGSGTTNPSKCFWLIMDQFMERIKIPTRLTYRAVGSSTGQKEFIGVDGVSSNDFGSGDIPFSTAAYINLTSSGVEMVQLPFLLGAISLFHSVPGVGDGLKLTSCLIAKIFNRQIVYWDDDSIVELNPGMNLPTKNFPIIVGHRVLGSSSTASVTQVSIFFGFCCLLRLLVGVMNGSLVAFSCNSCFMSFSHTAAPTILHHTLQYLYESCPADWPIEQVGSAITWANGTKACDGSGPMTTCIRDFPGTIGYIDSGHGIAENLDEIELKNADGNYLSSRTAQEKGGVTVAYDIPSAADQDFGVVDLLNGVSCSSACGGVDSCALRCIHSFLTTGVLIIAASLENTHGLLSP
jgi:ABC-type phosphate transport system substrate-binding protein